MLGHALMLSSWLTRFTWFFFFFFWGGTWYEEKDRTIFRRLIVASELAQRRWPVHTDDGMTGSRLIAYVVDWLDLYFARWDHNAQAVTVYWCSQQLALIIPDIHPLSASLRLLIVLMTQREAIIAVLRQYIQYALLDVSWFQVVEWLGRGFRLRTVKATNSGLFHPSLQRL